MTTQTIICRTCMLEMELPDGMALLTCPACGTNNSRPRSQGEELDFLRRAVHLRNAKEFSAAEACYNHVLMHCHEEHEALWGRLLCHYGVEILHDPRTGQRRPIVHIPRRKPMQELVDYAQACELAPPEIRSQYESDADYIDAAQAKIRKLAESCPPFDVFLCHKTSPDQGSGYTEDYARASRLYHRLTSLGYRVFFAPEEMEGVSAGANYEAGIYHALHTARVMLVVCSSEEHVHSTWVRSEWTRYLEMMDEESGRCLTPLLYGGMQPKQLPKPFTRRNLEAISMEGLDALDMVLKTLQRYCAPRAPEKPELPPQPAPQPPPVWQTAPPAPVQPVAPVQPAVQAPPTLPAANPATDFETEDAPGGVRVIRYHGKSASVVIPDRIGDRRVTAIGPEVFYNTVSPQSLHIPAYVTQIAPGALFGCTSLREISVSPHNPVYHVRAQMLLDQTGVLVCCPAGLNAGQIGLPAGVTAIGENAFRGCTTLQEIRLPMGVTAIGDSAFQDCAALTDVQFPRSITAIGRSAFAGCAALTAADLPPSLTVVSDSAFAGCTALAHVSLPGGIREIRSCAFLRCSSLTALELPRGITAIGDSAFSGCTLLKSIQLPASVTSIGIFAFHGCGALQEMIIPEDVTAIGHAAFERCPRLFLCVYAGTYGEAYARTMDVPCQCISGRKAPAVTPAEEFRTESGGGAVAITRFTGKGSTVVIPATIGGLPVTAIGKDAFADTEQLHAVHIPAGVRRIDPLALCHPALRQISVARGNPVYRTRGKALYTFAGTLVRCPADLKATQYAVPAGTKTIGDHAFSGCATLRGITLPESVTAIGAAAFRNCVSLAEVSLPAALRSVGEAAFSGCTALKKDSLPRGLRGESPAPREKPAPARQGSPSGTQAPGKPVIHSAGDFEAVPVNGGLRLTRYKGRNPHVYFPEKIGNDSVVSIGKDLFPDGFIPESLHIPASVTEIESLESCSRLRNIFVAPENPVFSVHDQALFTRKGGLVRFIAHSPEGFLSTHYTIPTGVSVISEGAFCGCGALVTVRIPDSVSIIRDNAFRGCAALTDAALPGSIRMIRPHAFSGCSSLTSVSIPRGVTALWNSAFDGCSSLTKAVLPDGLTRIGAYAFSGCRSLTEVNIPHTVTHILDYAFYNCKKLESLTLPESVIAIGKTAFLSCTKLSVRVHRDSAAHKLLARDASTPLEFVRDDKSSRPSLLSRLFGRK